MPKESEYEFLQNIDATGFQLFCGITEPQIGQLLEFAKTDPLVLKNTDDVERFKDREAFSRWRAKDRTIYVVTDEAQNLKGIIWFGPSPLPERNYTSALNPEEYKISLAMRLYGDDIRGQHLSNQFFLPAMRHYIQNFPEENMSGMWLKTSASNFAAQGAAIKAGFKTVTAPNEKGKIIMVASVDDLVKYVK